MLPYLQTVTLVRLTMGIRRDRMCGKEVTYWLDTIDSHGYSIFELAPVHCCEIYPESIDGDTMINSNFREMALSYHGCDGGNLSSPVWTCGLEWGGGYSSHAELEKELISQPYDACNPGGWNINGESVLACLSKQYNQKLAWLFAYLYDWNIQHIKDEAVKNNLFCRAGLGFKMNAYPLSFKNRNSVIWDEKIKDLIGMDSFDTYKEWCIQKRGEFFSELVNEHSPKAIICTGITSVTEFLRFFRCDIDTYRIVQSVHVAATNEGKTLIFIVPFFGGANGINSYEKMESIVGTIKNIAANHFESNDWHKIKPRTELGEMTSY